MNHLPQALPALNRADTLTMSSQEIATLCGKRHHHVLRDIRAYLGAVLQMEQGIHVTSLYWEGNGGVQVSGETPIGGVTCTMGTNPQNGQRYPVYHLDKAASLTVVSGYNVILRKRIIDRWLELEEAGRADPAAIDLRDPAQLARVTQQLVEITRDQAREIEAMREDVECLDRIRNAQGSFCITDAAKALQMRPKELFDWLQGNGWIYRRPGTSGYLGYQSRTAASLLEHKVTTVLRADGSEKVTEQVRVTAKGLTKLAALIRPRMR